MSDTNKIFFTGALGRIGSKVLPPLTKSHSIYATDLVTSSIDDIPVTAVDFTDFESLLDHLGGCDTIVHSAIASIWQFADLEELKVGLSRDRQHEFNQLEVKINVSGTLNLLEAAVRKNIRKFIFLSSMTAVLGDPGTTSPDQYPAPTNSYACTKLFGEQCGFAFQRQHPMQFLSLRIGQPYPIGHWKEHQWINNPRSRGMLVTLPDIARAIDAALNNSSVHYGIYHVVSHSDALHTSLHQGQQIQFTPQDYIEPDGAIRPATPQEIQQSLALTTS